MNIVIVTSGHPPFDERIFYKFGISIRKFNYDVAIVCSTENINTIVEGIQIEGFDGTGKSKKDKVFKLYEKLKKYEPDLIICCEPITILAAHRYKKERKGLVKIISDITEYYPHQNVLNQYSGVIRILVYSYYFLFNLYSTYLVDYLFIGETAKARMYNIFALWIKKSIIGYYPPLKFFKYSPPEYDGKTFTLCYSGIISEARGFPAFLDLVALTAIRYPDKFFIAKVIGKYEQPEMIKLQAKFNNIKNVRYEYKDTVDYKNYPDELKKVDICVDLREKNKIFNRSLPIKIFDCMACGRPVIFSNLDSLKGFNNSGEFLFLVEPDDQHMAFEKIAYYLNNPGILKEDSMNARILSEKKYNWEIIEKKIIDIIEMLMQK